MKILGYGHTKGSESIDFKGSTRWRFPYQARNTYQLDMYEEVANKALQRAGKTFEDVDVMIVACAIGVQPIPATSALLQERLGAESGVPCLDINTTCTSALTALDIIQSYFIAGRYQSALLVCGDAVSLGLNPAQKESYALFSDGAAALYLENDSSGQILAAKQETYSIGAHTTEIRGGLSSYLPELRSENPADFLFDMKGPKVLKLSLKYLPNFFKELLAEAKLTIDDIDWFVPHQASPAIPLAMKLLKIPEEKAINYFHDFGNMVSASVLFTLVEAMERGQIATGQKVCLMGTAAGLTINGLILQL